MTDTKPPLPEPCDWQTSMAKYSSDQMREYGRACEKAAYARAALLCLQHIRLDKHGYPTVNTSILEDVAAAIGA